jgi:hypothetical protein
VGPVGGKQAGSCRRQGRSGPDLTGGGDAQGWAAKIHPCVYWEVWGEEEEGLALSEDDGLADDNGGLRCAECAEGIYCGAEGGKKLVKCYALLRMRPLSIPCAECSVVISCGKVNYDKSG